MSLPNNLVINLSQWGLIKVAGPDAAKFLQGQLTCDIHEINETQSRLGAYCNVKGRVVATFRIFYFEECYYLSLPVTMIDLTLTQLKKYAVFSKVTLTNVTQDFIQTGCYGEEILKILQSIQPDIPTTVDKTISTNDFIIICIHGNKPRWLIIAKKSIKNFFQEKLTNYLLPADQTIWQALDIEAGIVTVLPETSELFTPQMIDYPKLNAVSFNKGCYLGQEIIARTHYLGKAKRQLRQAKACNVSEPIIAGDKLFAKQNEAGIVANVAEISESKYAVLTVIQEEALQEDLYLKNSTQKILLC